MAKLTSEQRRNLPKSDFGLPDDRRYPMPDAEHVLMAIRYFGSCEDSKRKELADNINRIAKKFKVTVNLSPSSKFKPYADKSIVAENAIPILETTVPREIYDIIRENDMCGPNDVVTFDEFNLRYKNSNRGSACRAPNEVVNTKIDNAINLALRNAAKNYLDREYYLDNNSCSTKIADFVYDSDMKICYDITRDFTYSNSVDDPKIIRQIAKLYNKDMLKNAFHDVDSVMMKNPRMAKAIQTIDNVIDKVECPDNMIDSVCTKLDGFDAAINNLNDELFVGCMPSSMRNFSEEEICWIEENFDKINEIMQMVLNSMVLQFDYPPLHDGTAILENIVKEMERRRIIDGYFIAGDNHTSAPETFVSFIKMKSTIYGVTHVCNAGNKCIATVTKLMDDNRSSSRYFNTIYAEMLRKNKLPRVSIRRIIMNGSNVMDDSHVLTEGIHLSKDGDISFDLSITKSYMDKYAAIHKVIKEHEKNKDYESMKHDLAYLFALICTIENKYVGKNKNVDIDSNDYKDAIKARGFAINDMKRYMSVVQRHQRSFNFMKFYTDNKYDKDIYTISHNTIRGMKSLLKIILG